MVIYEFVVIGEKLVVFEIIKEESSQKIPPPYHAEFPEMVLFVIVGEVA